MLRLKQYGVFLLCLPFLWGGGSMFRSSVPSDADQVMMNLDLLWRGFPLVMGWVTVIVCAVFAICPPDKTESPAGAKRAEER